MCWFCAGPCEWLKLVNLPSPIPELQHTPLPLYNVVSQGTCPRLLVFLLFSVWDSHLSPSRSWECVSNQQVQSWWPIISLHENNGFGDNYQDWLLEIVFWLTLESMWGILILIKPSFDVATILGVPPLSHKMTMRHNIVTSWIPRISNVSMENNGPLYIVVTTPPKNV